MKNFKRILCLLLALSIVGSLAACAKQPADNADAGTEPSGTEPVTPTTTPTTAPSDPSNSNPTTVPTVVPTEPGTDPTTPVSQDTTPTTAPTTAPTVAPTTAPTEPVHTHSFGDWQSDENNHWKLCECEERSEYSAHIDANEDEMCDTCAHAMPITAAPLATAEQLSNITAVKTASAGGSITAHPGGRLTYTITLTNHNSVAVQVEIVDTMPANTKYVSGGQAINGSNISWTLKRLDPGATRELTYVVSPDYTLAEVRASETDIILKNTSATMLGKVIAAPAKDIYVLETFNGEDIRKMEMAIDALVTANLTAKNSSKVPVSSISLASMMYTVGFSIATGFGTTDPAVALEMIFEKSGQTGSDNTSGGVEDVVDKAMSLLDRVVPHLYGGTQVPASKDSLFRGARATTVTIDDLISGDVIFVANGTDVKFYIVDGKHLVYLGTDVVTRSIDPATVLPGLPSSDKYAVVRPSINLNITFSLNEGEYFNDADREGYTDMEKALVATAEAFLLRGDRMQYTDDMTGKSVYRWESATRQPEDYTVDQYGYSNCAAFTYDVHWATYGVAPKAPNASGTSVNLNTTANLSSAASRGWNAETLTGKNKSTVFYYEPPKTTVDGKVVSALTDEQKEALKQQIYSLLRPGDIICIRRTTGSGHALLYVGNGTIIHSSGSNYSATNKTDTHEATARFRMVADLFDASIYNETSCVYNLETFSITRPQNLTTATPTANTVNRVENMQGIIAEKVASTAMGKTVNCGDKITYTFYVFNTTKEDKQITIQDVIGQYVTFDTADQGGVYADGNITWNLTVPADTRISVTYSVKVNEGVAAYTAIDGALATINGVKHKCIDSFVANTLTPEQQQTLVSAVYAVKGMDITGLTSIQILNLIYKTAFGIESLFGDKVVTENDLFNGSGVNNVGIFNDTAYYSDTTSMSMMDCNKSNAAMMVAPGLYGGGNVYSSSKSGETFTRYPNVANKVLRTRYLWEKDLVVGDIFMLRGSTTMYLYIYMGNNTFVNVGTGTKFAEIDAQARMQYAPATSTWKYFAVLRPSIVFENI